MEIGREKGGFYSTNELNSAEIYIFTFLHICASDFGLEMHVFTTKLATFVVDLGQTGPAAGPIVGFDFLHKYDINSCGKSECKTGCQSCVSTGWSRFGV